MSVEDYRQQELSHIERIVQNFLRTAAGQGRAVRICGYGAKYFAKAVKPARSNGFPYLRLSKNRQAHRSSGSEILALRELTCQVNTCAAKVVEAPGTRDRGATNMFWGK